MKTALYSGRPAPRPRFAAGLFPAETAAERLDRQARALSKVWQAVHGESMTVAEARRKLAGLAAMGISAFDLASYTGGN
jgi:hypothetical protein